MRCGAYSSPIFSWGFGGYPQSLSERESVSEENSRPAPEGGRWWGGSAKRDRHDAKHDAERRSSEVQSVAEERSDEEPQVAPRDTLRYGSSSSQRTDALRVKRGAGADRRGRHE